MTRDDAAQVHWQALQEGDLPQFVVYFSPKDFPGQYVVRLWLIGHRMGATNFAETFETLEQAREFIPQGLYCMPRADQDEAVIVETWF